MTSTNKARPDDSSKTDMEVRGEHFASRNIEHFEDGETFSANTFQNEANTQHVSTKYNELVDADETDNITKMMVDLWVNKERGDQIPSEETSNKLTEKMDRIVAKEMYEMRKDDREAIIEEVHGVLSRKVTESKELIESSLKAFDDVLRNLGESEIDTDIDGESHPLIRGHLRATKILKSCYVTSPEFRIRFLRALSFDVKQAALRYCKNLNHIWDLFGDIALIRPIHLTDLSTKEIDYLKKGHEQCLMARDKVGRRIYAVLGNYVASVRERVRAQIYLSYSVIGEDDTSQLNGAVNITFFKLSERYMVRFDPDERHLMKKFTECAPLRYNAIHFCMPDEPLYHFFKTLANSLLPSEMRASARVHLGSTVECCYALSQFGIPQENLPKALNGTNKTKSVQNFFKARLATEAYRKERCRLLNVDYVTKAMEEEIVSSPPEILKGFPPSCPGTDCPGMDCIVFGHRMTYNHPPNVKFREYLQEKRYVQESLKEAERKGLGRDRSRKERIFGIGFLNDIIDEVSEQYRFTAYDKTVGWYAFISPNSAKNRQDLRKKISQLMRDERKREARRVERPPPGENCDVSSMGVDAKRFKTSSGCCS